METKEFLFYCHCLNKSGKVIGEQMWIKYAFKRLKTTILTTSNHHLLKTKSEAQIRKKK